MAEQTMSVNGQDVKLTTNVEIRPGYSPYIGENGNWYQYDLSIKAFVDTGIPAQGEKGEKGDSSPIIIYEVAGEIARYIHEQDSASNRWIINHNMNCFPSVSVVDSANTVVFGQVNYIDLNNIEIVFSGQFSGKAYLN